MRQQFVGGYAALLANGVRGGVIIACFVDYYYLQDIHVGEFTVSATIKCRENGMVSGLDGVYGPQMDSDKQRFMLEMRDLQPTLLPQWCILGDFNLNFWADQKSNSQINIRLMNSFKAALDDMELKEMKPHGRRFTWSSEADTRIFTRIDHIFVTKDWELATPSSYVQALSTSASYHCPLLLTALPVQRQVKLRFEAFSTRLPGFLEFVQANWT